MPPAGPSRVLIIGCGASLRRDDQAGLRIGESVAKERLPGGVEVLLTESPAVDIPALLDGRSDIGLLVIVDAAAAGENHPPGTWRRFDYRRESGNTDPALHTTGAAPSGETDASPGRKPWVCGPVPSSKPRRGDRADSSRHDLTHRADGSKNQSPNEGLASSMSRSHTGSEVDSPPRLAASYDIHGPGVEAAIELCASLGTLPADVWVYAVAVADTDHGEELSAPVAAAINALADGIRKDVYNWLAGRGCDRA